MLLLSLVAFSCACISWDGCIAALEECLDSFANLLFRGEWSLHSPAMISELVNKSLIGVRFVRYDWSRMVRGMYEEGGNWTARIGRGVEEGE